MRHSSNHASRQVLLLFVALALAFFSWACGLGNSSLSSKLPRSGSGASFEITTNALVDAVAGHAYAATVATTGGSGALSTCTLLGSDLPSSSILFTTIQGADCVIHYLPSASDSSTTLRFTVSVDDTSSPANFDTRTFSLFARQPFSMDQASLTAGVQGRSYGTPSPFIQPFQSNVVSKAPASAVNQTTEFGNGPLTTCSVQSVTPINPGLQAIVDPSNPSRCLLESTSLTAAGTYAVTVAGTDSPILDPVTGQPAVEPGTESETLTLAVDQPLSLVPASLSGSSFPPDSVQGRTYGNVSAGLAEPTYNAAGGIGPYVFTTPPATASPTADGVPSGILCQPSPAETAVECSSGSATVTGNQGTYSFSIAVNDSGNSATPPSTSVQGASATVTQSLVVLAPLTVSFTQGSSANPSVLVDAVVGRSYGVIGDPPAFQSAGGVGTVSWCVNSGSLTSAVGLTGVSFDCTNPTTANSVSLTANPVIGPAGAYTFTAQATDTGDAAVPGASSATGSVSITVDPALAATLVQSGTTDPSALLDAVQGSSYGESNNFQGAPVASGTGGLGAGTYLWCVKGVAPNFTSISGTCGATTSTKSASVMYVSNAAGAAGTYSNLSFEIDDTGNAAVPPTFSGAGSAATPATSLTILSPLSLAAPSTVYPGVAGRTYGTGTGCSGGTCQPITFTLSGGDGTYSVTPAAGFPSYFTCTLAGSPPSGTYSCGSTAIPTTAAGTVTLQVTVSDSGSAAIAGSTSSPVAAALTVNPSLGVTSPTSTPPAVGQFAYGTGAGCTSGACQPLNFSISGGLGSYSVSPTPPGGQPDNFSCAFSQSGLSGSYSCSSSAVSSNPGPGTVLASIDFTVTDTSNASTPAGSSGPVTDTVTVEPNFTIALASGAVGSATDPAVQGRAFGSGSACSPGACAPLTLSLSGGLGSYSTPTASSDVGLSCAISGSTESCSSATVPATAAVGTHNFTVNAVDAANASTPAGNALIAGSGSLVVNAAVSLALTSGTVGGSSDPAVEGRAFGSGSACSSGACTPITFSLSGGLPPYTAPSVSPSSLNLSCTISSSTETCNSTAIPASAPTGTNALSVNASDTADASTPAGTAPTAGSATLVINAALAVKPPASTPDAVGQDAYGTGTGCSGGTCQPLDFSISGGLGSYVASGPPGGQPDGFTCLLSYTGISGTYSCSSAAIPSNSGPGNITGTISLTVTDTANASTPSGSSPSTPDIVTIEPNFTVSLTSGTSIGTSSDPAVQGRNFGDGSNCEPTGTSTCQPFTFSLSGGLMPYATPTVSPTNLGLDCAISTSTASCYGNPVSSSAPTGAQAFTANFSDENNASSPTSTVGLPETLTVNSALSISAPPAGLPNRLEGFPYPYPSGSSTTLTVSGGLSTDSWYMLLVGSTLSGDGACDNATIPTQATSTDTDLTLTESSGELSTLASSVITSASDTDFTFGVCVDDTANNSTPAGYVEPTTTNSTYTVNVFQPEAYVADEGLGEVEAFNTGTYATDAAKNQTATVVSSLTGVEGVAVTSDGSKAVVAFKNGTLAVIDTITNSRVGSAVTIDYPSGTAVACSNASAIAISGAYAYVACANTSPTDDELYAIPVSSLVGTSPVTASDGEDLGASGSIGGIAAIQNSSYAYVAVTLAAAGKLYVAAYNLPNVMSETYSFSGVSQTFPEGVALTVSGSAVSAYVVSANTNPPTQPTTAVAGDVDLFALPTPLASLSAPTVQSVPIIEYTLSGTLTDLSPEPTSVVVTPDLNYVYVGLLGSNQFAVLPSNLSSGPDLYDLPGATSFSNNGSATAVGSDTPAAVIAPSLDSPLPTGGYRLFFIATTSAALHADIVDAGSGSGSPAADANSPAISISSTTTNPTAAASIPVPQ